MLPVSTRPRRVVIYLASGTSGLYLVIRVWRLSRMPAQVVPLHQFLVKHADVIGVLSGYPVLRWLLGKEIDVDQPLYHLAATATTTTMRFTAGLHRLRQVFTALLIGLGLIERRVMNGRMAEVVLLSRRLQQLLLDGTDIIRELEAAQQELEARASDSHRKPSRAQENHD